MNAKQAAKLAAMTSVPDAPLSPVAKLQLERRQNAVPSISSSVLAVQSAAISFKCPLCGSNFKNERDAAQHVNKAHPDPLNTSSVKCDECAQVFTTKALLLQHKYDAHERVKGVAVKPLPQRVASLSDENGYYTPRGITF
jgi:predicted RNA-binding Zn-ribbon protein involved in translation (DUF1610 family)